MPRVLCKDHKHHKAKNDHDDESDDVWLLNRLAKSSTASNSIQSASTSSISSRFHLNIRKYFPPTKWVKMACWLAMICTFLYFFWIAFHNYSQQGDLRHWFLENEDTNTHTLQAMEQKDTITLQNELKDLAYEPHFIDEHHWGLILCNTCIVGFMLDQFDCPQNLMSIFLIIYLLTGLTTRYQNYKITKQHNTEVLKLQQEQQKP